MTERIPIVLAGLGWVGLHRHAVAIQRSPDFKLVGVIDSSADRARETGTALKVRHAAMLSDFAEIPWLGEAAAITIATPPANHYALAIAALARGLHVLTEKPFAMAVAQGEDMVRSARHANRQLCITHNMQFSHAARALQADVTAGRLGTLRRIHAVQLSNPRRRLPSWYETLPAGLFYDESPHLLYLIRRFAAGHLALEQAMVLPSSIGHQTPALVQARYADGRIPITLDMHFEAPVSEWHFTILGDEGLGAVDVFRDIYVRLPNDGLHSSWPVVRTSLLATGQHWMQHLRSGWGHIRGTLDYGNNEVYRRFAQSIRSGRDAPDIGVTDALAVLKMQHEILQHGSVSS